MRVSGERVRPVIETGLPAKLLERSWFPVTLVAYLMLAACLRTIVGQTLMYDESEQLALAQVLALGYGSQSPLILWVVWAVTSVVGPSSAAIIGVRFAALAFMYVALYACARAVIPTPNRAALAVACALLVPAVCWDFMLDKMHTPLACGMAALLFATVVRAVRGAETHWAAAVGVVAGLGVLSKYTFVPFAAGLAATMLTIPVYRQWLLSRRGLLALVAAVVVILPHATWAVANSRDLAGGIQKSMTDRPVRTLGGLMLSAADVTVMCFTTVSVVFACITPMVLRRRLVVSPEAKVLGRALLASVLVAVAIVVIAGGNRFKAHWFTPVAMLLPCWFVARLEGVTVPKWRVAGLWLAVGVTVLGLSVVAIVIGKTQWMPQGRSLQSRDRLAYDTATLLSSRPDTVICDGVRDAGNVLLACPGSTVGVLGTPAAARPIVQGSTAALVWDATWEDAIPPRTTLALEREFGLQPAPDAVAQYAGRRFTPTSPPSARRLGVIPLVPVPAKHSPVQ